MYPSPISIQQAINKDLKDWSLSHDFLDFLHLLLEPNPAKRVSAESIQSHVFLAETETYEKAMKKMQL